MRDAVTEIDARAVADAQKLVRDLFLERDEVSPEDQALGLQTLAVTLALLAAQFKVETEQLHHLVAAAAERVRAGEQRRGQA